MRKNNVQDMTIHEQLNKINEVICDEYCKWPAIYNEKQLRGEYKDIDAAMDALGDEICVNCPMMKL